MFEINIFTVVFCFGVYWCYNKWTNRHIHRLTTKFNGPPSYPIIGSTHLFLGTKKQYSKIAFKLLTDYGLEPWTLWLGPFLQIMITKPEDIQLLLNNSKALKKPWIYKFGKRAVGEGLVTASLEKWQKHRRIINPVFGTNILKQYFPIFNEKNDILVRNLRKEVGKTLPFDLMDYVFPMSLDTICKTEMGYNLNHQLNNKCELGITFFKAQDLMVKRMFSPWLYLDIVYSVYERLTGTNKVFETLHELPIQVINAKRQTLIQRKLSKNLSDPNVQENNNSKVFLDLLLKLNDEGADFSVEDIKDEVITMMLAGSETVTHTICYCLLMLAIHPIIQTNVYNEIYDIVGDSDEPITFDVSNKLKYLEQVIMETLRLFPSIPVIARELENDIKIFSGNCVLPKNTNVVINIFGTHRNPELYVNPLDFNPENFSPENIAKRHKYSYLPFGGGARNCIGLKYSMMFMKLTITKFLQNFSIHTDISLTDISFDLYLLLKCANGYPVTIKSRNRRYTSNLK